MSFVSFLQTWHLVSRALRHHPQLWSWQTLAQTKYGKIKSNIGKNREEKYERMVGELLCCWTICQVNAESYERASFCVHCGGPIRASGG